MWQGIRALSQNSPQAVTLTCVAAGNTESGAVLGIWLALYSSMYADVAQRHQRYVIEPPLSSPPQLVGSDPPPPACAPRRPVRLILGITILLLGLGTLSCSVGDAPTMKLRTHTVNKWVRTADGWERPGSWNLADLPAPQLHPFIVAMGQGLISILGLAAYRREG
jgi:hypothetical protein